MDQRSPPWPLPRTVEWREPLSERSVPSARSWPLLRLSFLALRAKHATLPTNGAMMKVYIAIFHDVESDEILGVFSTRDRAEVERKIPRAEHTLDSLAWEFCRIEEWEVQQ